MAFNFAIMLMAFDFALQNQKATHLALLCFLLFAFCGANANAYKSKMSLIRKRI
jgi:uncharacterized membrane protein